MYIIFCIALLVGFVDHAVAHGNCGTKSQSKEELDLVQNKINDFRKTRSSIGCKGCITIDTCIYVFHESTGERGQVDETVIDER